MMNASLSNLMPSVNTALSLGQEQSVLISGNEGLSDLVDQFSISDDQAQRLDLGLEAILQIQMSRMIKELFSDWFGFDPFNREHSNQKFFVIVEQKMLATKAEGHL